MLLIQDMDFNNSILTKIHKLAKKLYSGDFPGQEMCTWHFELDVPHNPEFQESYVGFKNYVKDRSQLERPPSIFLFID